MTSKDELGDRMKQYEGMEASVTFMPYLPIVARIDGRSFSKFTKPFQRPFDSRIMSAMHDTTKELVKSTNAAIGYTQSDEITLIFAPSKTTSEMFFGGRKQKIVSVLAGMASSMFNTHINAELNETPLSSSVKLNPFPHFDARVWQTPNLTEAANTLLWRAHDAKKNSVSMVAHTMYSHKTLQGVGQAAMIELIAKQDVDFHTYFSNYEKYGAFFQRRSFEEKIGDEIWERLTTRGKAPETNVFTRSNFYALIISSRKSSIFFIAN